MDYLGALLLGRYRILQFLGEGGMGLVYQAQDTTNDTLVAVKFMKRGVASSYVEDFIRFRKELDIVSRLEHPGIARVFGSGEYEGTLFYIMEFLDGEGFDRYILGKPVLAWKEIAEIFLKLAEILSYVHLNGIVHKDLKPGNLFVTKTETGVYFKLLDFGVAHIMELGAIKGEAEIAGTFGYMSPEAAGLFHANIDERSDLYSLGIIFYRLLTGELPFKATDVGRLLHQQTAATPVNPCKINKEIPAVLKEITMKLLAKDPDLRYQSTRGLLYDIDRYIKGDENFYIGEGDRKDKLTYHTKLVGRKHETEKITGLIRRAHEGKGGLCLISGEAGSGKSRLIEELRNYAYRQDMLFLEARCLNHENKTPYQPFKDILDGYIGILEKSGDDVKETAAEKIREIAGDFGEILVRLNPRIKRFLGETKVLVELEPDRENQRFLRVLSDFFCGFCEKAGGCVLVLDDLQWVDDGSVGLLREMAGKIYGSNLLVVGTYRDNEVDEKHGVTNIVKVARQHECPIEAIALERLDNEAVNELAACVLGEETENIKSIAGYLFEKSGGNPLHTVSILRELIENKMVIRNSEGRYIDIDRSRSLQVPENMLGIIMNRVGRLDVLCRELLCKAAIIGREFEIELLHRLTYCDYEELIGIIDNAVSMQLLSKSPDKRRLLFAHDRIRDAFYHMLEESVRRKLHRDIAAAIEELSVDDTEKSVYELAYHYIEANDGPKALIYATSAGDKARRSYANEEAVRFYSIALDLLESKRPEELSEWIRINECLIEVYLLIGRADDAIRMSEKLLPMLETPISKARVYKKIGAAYLKKADWVMCEIHIKKGLKLLGKSMPSSGPGLAAALVYQLFIYAWNRLLPGKTAPSGGKTDTEAKKEIFWMYQTLDWMYVFSNVYKCFYITLASLNLSEREIGPSKELGTSLSLFAAAIMIMPFFNKALKHHNSALDTRRKIGDELGVAQSLQLIGSNHLWKGDYSKSITELEESGRLLRKIGDSWEEGLVNAELMRLYIYTADYEKSMHYSKLHYDHCLRSNNVYGINAANLGRVNCLIEKGDFPDAEGLLDNILISTRDNGLWFLHCYALAYLGTLYIDRNQYDKACDNLERARQYYLKNSFLKDYIIFIFPHLAEAEIKKMAEKGVKAGGKPSRGELLKAGMLCREALKRTKPWPNHHGASIRAAAEFFYLSGKNAKAEDFFIKSISSTEKLGRRYETAKGCLEYGKFLKSTGRLAEAAAYLNKALSTFTAIGAKACAAECEAELYRGGSTENPGGNTARDRLRYDRRMNTVLSTGRHISSILDLDALLEKVLSDVAELVGAERGILLLYTEEDEKKLQARALHNIREGAEWDDRYTASSIISKVETDRSPLLVTDAVSEEAYKNKLSIISSAVRSVICVPVTAKGEMLGVIYLDNNLVNGLFNEDDLEIVSILAGQAGVSIQNARMYSQLKDYLGQIEGSKNEIAEWNRRLELRVEERTVELNERNRELASAIAQLKEHAAMVEELAVAKERNRFALDAHDHLGHSLTLLIKLLEVSRMTCLGAPDKLDKKLFEAERIAREGLEELRTSVKGLVSDKIHMGSLQRALEGLAEDFKTLGIQVDFSIQGLEDIGDTARIEILHAICMEASTNALKHGKAENISIIIRKEGGHIRMVIFDDGDGCKSIVKGFGLSSMEKRVGAMNGNIDFNSDGESGFIIRAELPYEQE